MKKTSKRRKKSSSSDQSGDSQEPCSSHQLLGTLGQDTKPEQSRLYKPSKKSARPEPEWTDEPFTSETRTPLDYFTPTAFPSLKKQEHIPNQFADPYTESELLDPTASQSFLQHYIPTTTHVALQLSNIAFYQPSTSFSTHYSHETDLERPTVIASTSQMSEPLDQYLDMQFPSTSYSSEQRTIGAPATSSSKTEYNLSTTPGCSKDTWQDLPWTEDVERIIDDPFHQSYDDVDTDSEALPPNLKAKDTSRLVLRNRLLEKSPDTVSTIEQGRRLAIPSTPKTLIINKKDAPPILRAEAPTCSTYQKASHELSLNLPADFIDIEDEKQEVEWQNVEPTQADNFLKDLSEDVDKSQPVGVDLERLLQSAKQKGLQLLRRGLKRGKGPGAQVKAHLKESIFIEKNRRLQKLEPIGTLFGVNPFKDVTQKNIFSYLAKKYPWMPKSDRPKQESTIDNLLKQGELVNRVLEAVKSKITPAMRFRMNHVLNNLEGILANLKDCDTPEQMLEDQYRKESSKMTANTREQCFLTISNDDGTTTNLSFTTFVLIYWFTNQHERIQIEAPSSSHQPLANFDVDLSDKNVDISYFEKNSEAAIHIANHFLNHRVILNLLSHQIELDQIAIQARNDPSIRIRQDDLARKQIRDTLEGLKRTELEKQQKIKAGTEKLEKEDRILQLEREKSEKKALEKQEKSLKQFEKQRLKEEKKVKEEEHKSYVKRIQEEMRMEVKSKKRPGGN